MNGLIYKDFLYLRKFCITFGTILSMTVITLILCTYFTCAVGEPSADYGYSTACIMASISMLIFLTTIALSTNLFVFDEKPTSINFLFSTPQAAKGQIQSKYYTLLLVNLGILFICFILDIILMLMIGEHAVSASVLCMLLFCFSLILLAIRIPFIIRFGSGISSIVIATYIIAIIAVVIIYGLFGDISFLFDKHKISLEEIFSYLQSGKVILPLSFIPYISVLIYYLSYRISLKLYRKGVESYEQ